MMLGMFLIGKLIGRIDYRILLGTGLSLMGAGLAVLSRVGSSHTALGIIIGSSTQGLGAGLLFTPLSMLAFSTLAPDTRTDAAGIYSLLRQLGCASGVALVTAVLRSRIEINLASLDGLARTATDLATLRAYAECFNLMAIAAMVVSPGIFLFRTE